jgi:preprotein translocase subunit YajC
MGNALGFIISIAVLGGAWWFLLVRPRQRQMAAHNRLMSDLAPGDQVMTSGGMYGVVDSIEDDAVWVEIAEDVVVRMARGAIARRIIETSTADD